MRTSFREDTTRRRLASFGFALSPWQTVDDVDTPVSENSKATSSIQEVAATDDDRGIPRDAR